MIMNYLIYYSGRIHQYEFGICFFKLFNASEESDFRINIQYLPMDKPINLVKLKQMIKDGISSIPKDANAN